MRLCWFFHLFFFLPRKEKKKEDRGKQKQIAPNYQRYQEMWMNNDAHENNAKENAEEVKKMPALGYVGQI